MRQGNEMHRAIRLVVDARYACKGLDKRTTDNFICEE
jgi:hypothetical protein